jgi:hypothetical protein
MNEEDYEDDVQEQEETDLRGEYVWNGHQLTSADSNVDDSGGHEAYFLNEIVGTLYDDAISLAQDIKQHLETLPETQLTDDQAEFLENFGKKIRDIGNSDHGYDSDNFLSFLGDLETVDPSSYNEFKTTNAETIKGFKNATLWGCKKGNIISRGHNFELWGWNRKQEKNLLEMVYKIANEDTVSPTTSLHIHDYSIGDNGKQYITTVGELESNEKPQNIVPGAVKTKSNIHIPWDRSMLQGDSNNFPKFKNWMKLREGRN